MANILFIFNTWSKIKYKYMPQKRKKKYWRKQHPHLLVLQKTGLYLTH